MKLSYTPGTSFFHQLDPLTKFSWVMLATVWLMSVHRIGEAIVLSLILTIFCLTAAQISLRVYFKTVLLILSAGIFLILFQGYFKEGKGVDLGPLHFSYYGLMYGAALAFRSFGFVASSLAFSQTTKPRDIGRALEKVGMPYRFAHIGYLAFRFLPLFERDYQALTDAQKLRGIKPGFKQMQRSLLALVLTEIRRGEETAIALETRAFGLHPTQTKLDPYVVNPKGVVLIAITAILIIAHVFF